MSDLMLSLFDIDEAGTMSTSRAAPARPSLHSRILADSANRVAWLKARSQGVTATDAARLTTAASVQAAAFDKLCGSGFGGNAFTDHGNEREPVIAAWVLKAHSIRPSTSLYHAEHDRRHLATPDGVALRPNGTVELAEIKTTNKAWRSIPRHYLRQVWWQQYVLGADRTLLVWEQHDNFVPVGREPQCRWIDRDENEIAILVGFANQLLDIMAAKRNATAGY